MSGFIETFRGVVYPWHCDHLGHMTVMHYVGMFDQAAWHLFSAMGITWESMRREERGFVDVKHETEYRAEQRAGSLIVVESALTRIGNSSMTGLHRMKNTETGVIAATSAATCVYFDLEARTKLPLTDELKERMQAFLVEAAD